MDLSKYEYDRKFFDYVDHGAQRSAHFIVSHLLDVLRPRSVLDVGCGRGVWCREWRARGVEVVIGIDGEYVELDRLVISPELFVAHDLTRPLDLGRRFDLVTSLEVAEHLPAETAEVYLDTLIRHGDTVLFSAAVPGQGGEHHINEQPHEYWRQKFLVRGYRFFDFVRQRLRLDRRVEPWYRYNTMLFVSDHHVRKLPKEIVATEVSPTQPIPLVGSLSWRARLAVLRRCPSPLVHRLARLKHRAIVATRAGGRTWAGRILRS